MWVGELAELIENTTITTGNFAIPFAPVIQLYTLVKEVCRVLSYLVQSLHKCGHCFCSCNIVGSFWIALAEVSHTCIPWKRYQRLRIKIIKKV